MNQNFTLVSFYIKNYLNKQRAEMCVDHYEPSDYCVRNILNYSKSLVIHKSSHIGFLELMGN